jgi:hypothetical protein
MILDIPDDWGWNAILIRCPHDNPVNSPDAKEIILEGVDIYLEIRCL